MSVVTEYDLSHIDFDIEGSAVSDPASIALRSEAIALLQKEQSNLDIGVTLPVLPDGLTTEGINVVRSALKAGVDLDIINIMAMDYGDAAAPPDQASMGTYAIRAAENTYSQLTSLYADFGQTIGWENIGVTPMIGVNDVTTEVFKQQDAQQLLTFAENKGLGMLSMWSIARDQPAPSGQTGQVGLKHSGLSDAKYTFANTFKGYGNSPVLTTSPSTTPETQTPGTQTPGTKPDVVTGGNYTTVAVKDTDTLLNAVAGKAESFKLHYEWGHNLTIKGFNPLEDRFDLSLFWGQAADAVLGSDANNNVKLSLPFNQQTVVLEGVGAKQIDQVQLFSAS